MSRPASVFVRPLTGEEAVKLRRISRQSKVFALRQRAQIVLASDSQSTASEIARVLQTDENQVRRVIREFNEMGMDFLRPRSGGGRPRRIDHEIRERIRAVALARPQDLGEPFTRWSLTTLRRYLVTEEIVDRVSKEHLRRILNSLGITAQRTRTWKKSNDPYFEQKKSWVLSAYRGGGGGHHRRRGGLLRRVRSHIAQTPRRSGLVPKEKTRPPASDLSPHRWRPKALGRL